MHADWEPSQNGIRIQLQGPAEVVYMEFDMVTDLRLRVNEAQQAEEAERAQRAQKAQLNLAVSQNVILHSWLIEFEPFCKQ